jgi:hypothetical protein
LWYIKIDFCIEGVDMKKIFALSFSVIFIFALVVICFAHPGGTDGSGGHYDRNTGEYHYHHGYPEHQHEDGECPYNYRDNTNHSSKSSIRTSQILDIFKAIIYSLGYAIAPCAISWMFMPKGKYGWLLPVIVYIVSAILIFLWLIQA